MAQSDNEDGLTLTVLGCGTLGTAILSGMMASMTSGTPTSDSSPTPARLPTKFNACVRSASSASRIESALSHYPLPLTTYTSNNAPAIRASDVIILGCKPYMASSVLAPLAADLPPTALLISICAGLPESALRDFVGSRCPVVRVMPNTPSSVGEGMAVVSADPSAPLSAEHAALVQWIFARTGRVVTLPAAAMDAATGLSGAGPAFMAVILDAMADGGVAMGIPRREAQIMAAQTMRGAATLVLGGEHPGVMKDKVCTPGGCTIGGVLVLEDAGVRGAVSRAVREATVVASELGSGKGLVNGTRH